MISYRNWILIGLLLVATVACIYDDENAPTPDEVFVKYYGVAGSQDVEDMLINRAGNVVILANQTRAAADANRNVWVFEVDSSGNQVSGQEAFIDVGSFFSDTIAFLTEDIGKSIKEIDNGYILTGYFSELIAGQTQQTAIFWAQLDQNLEIIKVDTIRAGNYSSTGATADNVFGNDIIQTSDGNVVIVGHTNRQEVNDQIRDPGDQYFLVKRDFLADTTVWRKTYGFRNSDEEAIAVFELDNGNIALVGHTDQIGNGGGEGRNISLKVFNDLATSQVTSRVFGTSINDVNTADDIPFDVIQVAGVFIIVGTATEGQISRPFLKGITETGSLVYSQILQSKYNINATGRSVTVTRENDLVVVGSYPSFSVATEELDPFAQNKNGEVMFMRTGQTGFEKEEFEGNFGLVSGNDIGKTALTLLNGSVIIGATIDFGSNQTMVSLIKLNDRGLKKRQ
jgi:hypothetical protein